jgi:hypothetical protein
VVADRGFAGHALRGHAWDRGARPVIPPERDEAPAAWPAWAGPRGPRQGRAAPGAAQGGAA